MTIEDVINSVAYKPGWKIQYRAMHGVPAMWVDAAVIDSDPPHEPTTIQHLVPIPPLYTDDKYTPGRDIHLQRLWVRDTLEGIERHELGEWLRFGGERPFMPYHGETGGDPYAVPS